MTDSSILTKYKNKREYDIIYKPRDGDEMQKATLHHIPLYKYSELCELAKKSAGGPRGLLAHMFKRSKDNIILLQDPNDMNSGHWISVSCDPKRHSMYFFSTYGGKPDIEKMKWMNEDDLTESNQLINIFNEGLRQCQGHGWEIHYNDFPFQKEGDKTAYCGIYTAAFLRSGKNPEEFIKETKSLMKSGINPAVYYYDKYFD